MNTSTVTTVKSAIVAALTARTGLAGIQVAYSNPGTLRENECIWFAETRGRQEFAAIRAGRKPRDETYTLILWIDVVSPGATVAVAEARAMTLLAEVESMLADDPSLAANGLAAGTIVSAKAGDFGLNSGEVESGRPAAALRFGIDVTARLS